MRKDFPELVIGDLVVKTPIVQGGMGVGISLSGLASAVAEAGGIGVLSCVGIGLEEEDFKANFRKANKRALIREIKKCRENTDGIIGVNIMVALSDFDEFFKTSIEEKVDIIFMGAGLPLKLPESVTFDELIESKTKIAPIVSSGKAAKVIFRSWAKNYDYIPDAVVVEGPLAGGHLGFKNEQVDDPKFQLENIVPEVVAALKPFEEKYKKKIPVIAGGGIFTGEDIDRIMKLGADAVQIGSRFVATNECDASDAFKQCYVDSKKEDIQLIKSPLGLPGRAIMNGFLTDVANGEKKPFKCPWKCIKHCDFRTAPYCIGVALANSKKGLVEEGFAFAGANTYRIDKIVSVQELVDELRDEYCKL
jgi:NAD(P)H-dependent flavin oxidoreductase YrpB (nitropropane dioxygenase family)